MRIVAIVEGDGEVAALPLLLRRIANWRTPEIFPDVPAPIRVRRDRFINREDEFRRHLLLAAAKAGDDGWVLILLDADDDCAFQASQQLLARAHEVIPHRRVSVVMAVREYEAWFIAASASLNGQRGLVVEPGDVAKAEEPRDAKGWLKQRMPGRSYGETTDQPAFTAAMDLAEAHERSRSFRKLCSEWDRHVHAAPRP
ncbi:MAG: DUF4276 family protein [Rubrivivax sp.]